jgi:Fe-S oxidoreductase
MWKEEEEGQQRVSEARLDEARQTGAETVAVGCPFCMVMMEDAARSQGDVVQIKDVVELIDERLQI